MSDTMLERVARGLCAAAEANWDAASFNETANGDEPEEQRGYFLLLARAAIEAMREPTENVVDAMNDVWIDGPGYVSMNASLHDCRVLFNAAIDAALQPATDSEGK